jgi:hypothetical protein
VISARFNLSASAVANVFKDKSRILEVKKAFPLSSIVILSRSMCDCRRGLDW